MRFAGSERCVLELLRTFPGSRLLATLVEPEQLPPELRGAEPSVLQRLPRALRRHEWLVPAMPAAWALRQPLEDVDLVISSSHACAKAVRVAPGVPHLCYCHTPMRYAWLPEQEASRFPPALRPLLGPVSAAARRWDRGTAARVTRFLANSTAVARRIEAFYGREAEVVFPPVRTDFFTPGGDAEREGFLYAGRLVGYKRADLVVEAFADLPFPLTVVGDGHLGDALRRRATPNVRFLAEVGDEELRDLYRSSLALVFPGEEDFGIVMAEAQACGTPVVAAAAGGALDIVEPGATGWLLDRPDAAALRAAVRRAASERLDAAYVSARAQRFAAGRFRAQVAEAASGLVAG